MKKPFLVVVAFVAVGVFLVSIPSIKLAFAKPLPVLGQVADFYLVDTESSTFTKEKLDGKIWVADFFFTTCSGPCPRMSDKLAELHRSYLLESDVRFVSISVNPGFDSPQVLKEYSAKYGANLDHWYFLTGDKDAIKKLTVESFKIGSVDDPVFHSTRFVLVDRKGKIRGYYDTAEETSSRKLFRDIALLLREKTK